MLIKIAYIYKQWKKSYTELKEKERLKIYFFVLSSKRSVTYNENSQEILHCKSLKNKCIYMFVFGVGIV